MFKKHIFVDKEKNDIPVIVRNVCFPGVNTVGRRSSRSNKEELLNLS